MLRERWGFDGIVVADYIGVSLLYQHHGVAADRAEAAALAFRAGLDVETPATTAPPRSRPRSTAGSSRWRDRRHRAARADGEAAPGPVRAAVRREGAIELQAPAAVGGRDEVARQAIVVLENRWRSRSSRARPAAGRGDRPHRRRSAGLLSGYSFPVHLIISGGAGGAGWSLHARRS